MAEDKLKLRAREVRERLDQYIDREGEWNTAGEADAAIAAFAAELVAEALAIPDEILKRYEDAAEKAESVGAMKPLKNIEAEMGRLLYRRHNELEATLASLRTPQTEGG